MQRNVWMETRLISNPFSHLCLRVIGVCKIIGAGIHIAQRYHCIRSIAPAKQVHNSTAQFMSLWDPAVARQGIEPWHVSSQLAGQESSQNREKRSFRAPFHKDSDSYHSCPAAKPPHAPQLIECVVCKPRVQV